MPVFTGERLAVVSSGSRSALAAARALEVVDVTGSSPATSREAVAVRSEIEAS